MKQGFFAELKRRHVYRVAAAYAVVGWLLVEVGTQVFPFFQVPDGSIRLLVLLVIAGFPIALVLAWAFEMTPDGVRRTEPAQSPEARAPEQHRKVGRMLDFLIIGVLALALALSLWRPWSHRPARPSAAAGALVDKSIAVLPFENLSTDTSNAYFADGMQDLILTKLADIGELKVISRTSTMQYGSHPRNLRQIARELGVSTVLEGSVQKAGNQVLINVQLINAQTDAHIWAQSYQRNLDNIFGVEGEVAGKIAQSLAARLSPAESRRLASTLSANPAANILYMQAEHFYNQGTMNIDIASFRKAIPLYRQALALAPDFAKARAGLSITESLSNWFGAGGQDLEQLNADALTQAKTALAQAPTLAAAWLAIGYADYYARGDYATALKEFDAALKLSPNDASARVARGYILRRLGRYDEALASFRMARNLDPRNSLRTFDLGVTNMMLGRYDKAESWLHKALSLDPGNVQAKAYLALSTYLDTGDASRALDMAKGDAALLKSIQERILTMQRRYRDALDALDSIPDASPLFSDIFGAKSLTQARLYRFMGQTDKARSLYAASLPLSRALLAHRAGGAPIMQAFPLNDIAEAETALGQTQAGLADLKRVLAITHSSGDRSYTSLILLRVAISYALSGHSDLAASTIDQALSTPGIGVAYTPRLLWQDPVWDPVRASPAFKALLRKYAGDKPVGVSSAH